MFRLAVFAAALAAFAATASAQCDRTTIQKDEGITDCLKTMMDFRGKPTAEQITSNQELGCEVLSDMKLCFGLDMGCDELVEAELAKVPSLSAWKQIDVEQCEVFKNMD